ncbi:MAG TPA: hypothetical protein VG055_32600 [Planctomycetaceae bacterium]|nr:hypothetical protein [Planctomycetaceae bacterium]
MPVTPCPPTIFVDLPSEYLEFLDMAAKARSTTHQVIMRDALAMLHADDWSRAVAMAEHRMANKEEKIDPHLAAWDRWSRGDRRQPLPLTGEMALFVTKKVADDGYKDPTKVVLLALLCYAKLMGFFVPDEDGEP